MMLLNPKTGQRALYALPIGSRDQPRPRLEGAFWSRRVSRSRTSPRSGMLSGRSGATRCSRPCAATGREDIWGVGLRCRSRPTTPYQFFSSCSLRCGLRDPGREAHHRRPEIRHRLIEAIDGYTAIYRKGCTPPGLVTGAIRQQQAVPGPGGRHDAERYALDSQRAQGASGRTTTTRTPRRSNGPGPTASRSPSNRLSSRQVFKAGGHVARQGVRPLPGGRGLARALSRLLRRAYPAADVKLLEQPFWLDPSDPHHMASAIQFLTRPLQPQLFGRLRRPATHWS